MNDSFGVAAETQKVEKIELLGFVVLILLALICRGHAGRQVLTYTRFIEGLWHVASLFNLLVFVRHGVYR